MAEPALQEEKRRGRPVGSKGKISRLRRLLTQLEGMAKTQAPQVIQRSLDGEAVDKDQLATAKWIVNTVVTVHKACVAEEEIKNGRAEAKEEVQEEVDVVDSPSGTVFTLKLVEPENH